MREPEASTTLPRALDYLERLFVALLAVPFVIAFAQSLSVHPQFILIAASELLAVVLILTRKRGEMAISAYAFFIAIVGTAMPLMIRPTDGAELVPVWLSTTLMLIGLTFNVSAKLFLNRSFGIVAANRGVKRGGPYRIVRHPMYLGYITTQIGFLLASFSLLTLLFYVTAWVFQVLRIREEEKLLLRDEAYASYSATVRHRLIPGIY